MDIVKPETIGFSSERLARIHRVMQRYVDENKLAGIITLIARHGKVVHFEKFGKADIEGNKPMQSDSIFRIYSMTKPITSTAIMMLFEEGLLRLSDPVSNFIPAFKKMKVMENVGSVVRLVDAAREITLLDLLTHTAGLSYGFEEDVVLDDSYRKKVWHKTETHPDLTMEAFVHEIAKLPLAFHPGRAYRYSVAIDVLGLVVQVVSGMPFEDFLRQRIFEPLRMEDTGFYVPAQKVARFCANYGPDKKGGLKVIDVPESSRYTRPTKNPSGGGGLVSSTEDYYRFTQMLLNKGELDGVRLLGRKTVEMMMLNHLPVGIFVDGNPAAGFGLGGSVLLDAGKSTEPGSVGNWGWGGAANTNFWVDPHEDLLGILMLQFMPSETYPVRADFRALAYQALVD